MNDDLLIKQLVHEIMIAIAFHPENYPKFEQDGFILNNNRIYNYS